MSYLGLTPIASSPTDKNVRRQLFSMSNRNKALPPVYFLVAIVTMICLHFVAPIGVILLAPVSYLGALIFVIGVTIVIWPAIVFDKAGTSIKPFEGSTYLVTDGLYQVTRNPMYLGMVVILTGIAVLFGTISPFIPIPLFCWLIQTKFIVFEEAALEETFNDEYRNYKKRVRRWL